MAYMIVQRFTEQKHGYPRDYITQLPTDRDLYSDDYGNPLFPIFEDLHEAKEALEGSKLNDLIIVPVAIKHKNQSLGFFANIDDRKKYPPVNRSDVSFKDFIVSLVPDVVSRIRCVSSPCGGVKCWVKSSEIECLSKYFMKTVPSHFGFYILPLEDELRREEIQWISPDELKG